MNDESTLLRRHNRFRLAGYEYAREGTYFVTLVTRNREVLFEREDLKEAVEEQWRWLSQRYEYVHLDEFVVMPNHLHGLLFIDGVSADRSRTAPTSSALPPKRLGSLIGAFKTVSTQEINRLRRMPGEPVWQRNFHDHIVRDGEDLSRIREYILDNPRKWDEDPEHS